MHASIVRAILLGGAIALSSTLRAAEPALPPAEVPHASWVVKHLAQIQEGVQASALSQEDKGRMLALLAEFQQLRGQWQEERRQLLESVSGLSTEERRARIKAWRASHREALEKQKALAKQIREQSAPFRSPRRARSSG